MAKGKGKKRRNERIFIGFAAALIVILIVYALITTAPDYITIPTRTPASSPDVPQIGPNSVLQAQWYVHLDIFINGTRVQIPGDLGHVSDNTILYAINTQDTSGVIRLQTPTFNDYNLSNIFEIWGYPTFTRTQILTYTGTSSNIYLNGTIVPFSGNYYLSCHDEFAIIVGTAPHSIPAYYTFGSALACIG